MNKSVLFKCYNKPNVEICQKILRIERKSLVLGVRCIRSNGKGQKVIKQVPTRESNNPNATSTKRLRMLPQRSKMESSSMAKELPVNHVHYLRLEGKTIVLTGLAKVSCIFF